MARLALMTLVWVSTISHAGNRVGNGGDVLDCKTSIQILDFFENQGNTTKPQDSATDYRKIVEERLLKLKRVAPDLSEQYLRRLKSIEQELDFKEGAELTDIEDSLHAFVPADSKCKLKQIIIRKNVIAGSEKRFIVDKKLWDRLAPWQKAGIVSHEIIYEHFFKLGETDSVKARKLNSMIFSTEIESMSAGQFWQFIQEIKIPIYP